MKSFNYCSSIVAVNEGNGHFEIRRLPVMAQLSSVNAIQFLDVNNDGILDMVAGGNQYDFLPQFERLDASFGDVLLNDGKGNFSWVDQKKTGLDVEGQVRDLAKIKTASGTEILFLRNNDFPKMYRLNLKTQMINQALR